jgi:hypothetical protein
MVYEIYEVNGQVQNNQSDSKSDSHAKDVSYNQEDWATDGHKRNRFPLKYDARIKGELKHKKNPDEIYERFDDNIRELIAEDTNICAK